jgi:hypothetical protein
MPLQNRVDPFGELFAAPARGLFMGNRGGRFHTDAQRLTARRWVSRQWICCLTKFKARQREVWGRFCTELFFLDEPTAFAAGHRPCFECRRKDAEDFAEHWRKAHKLRRRPRAGEMDQALHRERLNGRAKRLHRREIETLPDGAFITLDSGRLRRAVATATAGCGQRPDPAGDSRAIGSGLSNALASECHLSCAGLTRASMPKRRD